MKTKFFEDKKNLNFQLLSALSMLSHSVLHNPEIMLQHPKLPLGVGDLVNVLVERGGWLYGQLARTGRHGWFPRECLAAQAAAGAGVQDDQFDD